MAVAESQQAYVSTSSSFSLSSSSFSTFHSGCSFSARPVRNLETVSGLLAIRIWKQRPPSSAIIVQSTFFQLCTSWPSVTPTCQETILSHNNWKLLLDNCVPRIHRLPHCFRSTGVYYVARLTVNDEQIPPECRQRGSCSPGGWPARAWGWPALPGSGCSLPCTWPGMKSRSYDGSLESGTCGSPGRSEGTARDKNCEINHLVFLEGSRHGYRPLSVSKLGAKITALPGS